MAVIAAVLAAFGHLPTVDHSRASPVFPAAGSGVAVVIIYGHRMLPALFVGVTLADYLNDTPVILALWKSLAVIVGAGLGAELTRRFVPRLGQPEADAPAALQFLLLAAGAAPGVAALVGTAGLHMIGGLPAEAISFTALAWWFGDATGVITVAPFVLAWLMPARRAEALARPGELVLLVGLTAAVVAVAFGAHDILPIASRLHAEFALLPFFVWGALRFGLVGAATTGFVVAAIATSATIAGLGPYGGGTAAEVRGLQLMLVVGIVTAILLGVSTSHKAHLRRKAEADSEFIR